MKKLIFLLLIFSVVCVFALPLMSSVNADVLNVFASNVGDKVYVSASYAGNWFNIVPNMDHAFYYVDLKINNIIVRRCSNIVYNFKGQFNHVLNDDGFFGQNVSIEACCYVALYTDTGGKLESDIDWGYYFLAL